MTALLSYEGEVRRLVGAVKYRNRRDSFRWLALQVAAQQTETDFDCVTWIPSSSQGWARRGYDPARLIANGVGIHLRLPVIRLLSRGNDIPQSKCNREDRLDGPVLRMVKFAPGVRRVLMVDDVCTTGGSLAAAAIALRARGINLVHAAVAASTPHSVDVGS